MRSKLLKILEGYWYCGRSQRRYWDLAMTWLALFLGETWMGMEWSTSFYKSCCERCDRSYYQSAPTGLFPMKPLPVCWKWSTWLWGDWEWPDCVGWIRCWLRRLINLESNQLIISVSQYRTSIAIERVKHIQRDQRCCIGLHSSQEKRKPWSSLVTTSSQLFR